MMRTTGTTRFVTGCLAVAVVFGFILSVSVEAAPKKGIEPILEKHRLSSSDSRDIARNYRAVVAIGAEPSRVESLVDGALSAGFDADELVRCLDLISAAGLNGLPHESLLAKMAEGVAKRVDADDVIDAVERRALSLKRARQLLSSVIYDLSGADGIGVLIQTVASAIDRGISERDIVAILKDEAADPKKVLYQLDKMR
jgi:hypothetical protein